MSKASIPTENFKPHLRKISKMIAHCVRNQLEDLHVDGVTMTDDNMPDINKCIRKWVYEWLIVHFYYNDIARALERPEYFHEYYGYYPDYWEDDVFDDIDKDFANLIKNYGKK